MNARISGGVKIAGLCYAVDPVPSFFENFICRPQTAWDGEIRRSEAPFCRDTGQIAAEHPQLLVWQYPDGSWLYSVPGDRPGAELRVSGDYRLIEYWLPEEAAGPGRQAELNNLLRTALECRFCLEDRMSLHSACVVYDNCAVAFTGPSGMGKSTRARAWIEALNASFLSGDRPVIGLSDGGAVAFGAPWDGKEQIYRAGAFPLKAVLEVRRSASTYLRRLRPEQARKVLLQQSFIPMWDVDAAFCALLHAKQLAAAVPVYRLFCGPDADAAREACRILFRCPETILEEENEVKIKDGFVLRNVLKEYIVMPTGTNIARFDGAIALNEVSAFLFEKMKNPVSREDLLRALLAEYEVDEATAARDLDALLDTLRGYGVLEETE